jgi:hypothetical protein
MSVVDAPESLTISRLLEVVRPVPSYGESSNLLLWRLPSDTLLLPTEVVNNESRLISSLCRPHVSDRVVVLQKPP